MATRAFTREFKLAAIRQVREEGRAKTQVARDLGIHISVLRHWCERFEEDPEHAFPGQGQMKPADGELARLERELRRVTAERDILKKALGYFAKEPK